MTLEELIDKSIRLSVAAGRPPVRFLQMWERHGLCTAMKLCVSRADETSGYRWAVEHGLKEWTLEMAVDRFPERFDGLTVAYARMRLAGKSVRA